MILRGGADAGTFVSSGSVLDATSDGVALGSWRAREMSAEVEGGEVKWCSAAVGLFRGRSESVRGKSDSAEAGISERCEADWVDIAFGDWRFDTGNGCDVGAAK